MAQNRPCGARDGPCKWGAVSISTRQQKALVALLEPHDESSGANGIVERRIQ